MGKGTGSGLQVCNAQPHGTAGVIPADVCHRSPLPKARSPLVALWWLLSCPPRATKEGESEGRSAWLSLAGKTRLKAEQN